MRYALIIAGGSGTRLWPMSRADLPKQLIPFINGKSLLEIAFQRLEGLIPASRRYICAGLKHRDVIFAALPELGKENFLGEPMGRDTLNAIGLSAAVLAAKDPQAVFAVLTADHLIEPVDKFQKIIEQGFALVERASANAGHFRHRSHRTGHGLRLFGIGRFDCRRCEKSSSNSRKNLPWP